MANPQNGTPRQRTQRPSELEEIPAGDTGPTLGTGLASVHASHSPSPSRTRFSKRRKNPSFLRRCKQFVFKHTWTIPLVLLLVVLSLYAVNPAEANIIRRFIFLSYKLPVEAGADPNTPPQYGKGLWDLAFVTFYMVVLSFTREFITQEILRPLARLNGINSRGKQARFMEQMYTAVYFSIMGPAGLYVMSRSPVWYFNTRGMYEFFPHKTHEAVFKFYYLFQAAYWAQQAIVLVLGLEKPRKDFKELVGHHIVTLALIALSYRFHFTYMGIAVYLTHDISDFFLAASKSLNYVKSPLQSWTFGLCIAVWIYMRHYINLKIIFSLFNEFQTIGPYELNWETQQYKSPLANVIALGLLASLQALNLFWLFCLFRSAYKLVVLKIAKDDRSEVEESELEDMARKKRLAESKLIAASGLSKANGNGHAAPLTKRKGTF
ncbi:Sphingosine N-acyltransferase-like protein FUM17 [Lachnellula suecica]|uniref:Sphingosine N-acyltransferase-like protein FUM17 n=1 Tax=Lachnellula suecica TaxID=602035 RepID=A0A8T9BVG0_9HELO|nr:Sphingosine N-acyltransferase-like protein FUM17 [Lachnellula suecica]